MYYNFGSNKFFLGKKLKENEVEKKNFDMQEILLTDTCICCGKPVPEGTMVCFDCEQKSKEELVMRYIPIKSEKIDEK